MIQITCINKDGGDHYDPHEAITNFGWVQEGTSNLRTSNAEQMISFLEQGGRAFVLGDGRKAMLVVRSRFGRKYVKTVADGYETDNLLALQECRL